MSGDEAPAPLSESGARPSASGAKSSERVEYTLSEEAARARARTMAVWRAIATAMPPLLVVVLVREMDLAPMLLVLPIAALVLALAATRAIVDYGATARRLRALVVTVDEAGLVVKTARGPTRIPKEDIRRINEVTGPLGGLRLLVREREDLPGRVDLPRGGARFAELRVALEGIQRVEPTRRRGRVARVAFGVAIVLAIFFLPFFVEDVVARSRLAAGAVILALWVAMRAAIGRA